MVCSGGRINLLFTGKYSALAAMGGLLVVGGVGCAGIVQAYGDLLLPIVMKQIITHRGGDNFKVAHAQIRQQMRAEGYPDCDW